MKYILFVIIMYNPAHAQGLYDRMNSILDRISAINDVARNEATLESMILSDQIGEAYQGMILSTESIVNCEVMKNQDDRIVICGYAERKSRLYIDIIQRSVDELARMSRDSRNGILYVYGGRAQRVMLDAQDYIREIAEKAENVINRNME